MPKVPPIRVNPEIPEAGTALLEAAGLPYERAALLAPGLDQVEAVLPLLTDRIDVPFLSQAKRLRIVANMAVGTDNVDLEAALAAGVAVTNTPDVLTDATADLAFGLLLAAARGLVWADRYVRSGAFVGWTPSLGVGLDLAGRTLGIIGAGRIGRAVAERGEAFRLMPLLHSRRSGTALRDVLARSDFVSLHVPLGPDTVHLIGEAELACMKPTAVLVNTARGPIVDEAALVRALQGGVIAAAGLDVFENEPRLAPGLAERPNVVLAPHLGSATFETRNRMAEIAARNIVAALAGEPLVTPV